MLTLYATRYPNIKRTTKRHVPESCYYVVFERKLETGTKKKFRKPLGQISIESAHDKGLAIMRAFSEIGAEQVAPQSFARLQQLQLEATSPYLRASTVARYQLSDRVLAAAFGADTLVKKISSQTISSWVLERQSSVSNSSTNRDIARLRQLLNWALDEEWITQDPMRKVRKLQEPEPRDRYLSEEELRRLWSVCSPWLWRIVWFSLLTGLRANEQFSLKWSQIRDGQIRLSKEGTKGKKSRVVPITPEVAEILESLSKNREFELVFATKTGKRIIFSNFCRDHWRPVLKSANIENYTWHCNRHTFISWLVQSGGKLEKVQRLAGHSDFKTTLNYSHMAPEHLVETINLVSGRGDFMKATPIGHARSKTK